MDDLWAFLIVRLKLWAYSPFVVRDVVLMVLIIGMMLVIVRSSEMMRKYRRSVDAANLTVQAALDATVSWGKRIEEVEQRLAFLEKRAIKPHYVAASTLAMKLPGLSDPRKKPNGDARPA